MFPVMLPFKFPVHDMPILLHKLLSSDRIRDQNISIGNDTSAHENDAACDEGYPTTGFDDSFIT